MNAQERDIVRHLATMIAGAELVRCGDALFGKPDEKVRITVSGRRYLLSVKEER